MMRKGHSIVIYIFNATRVTIIDVSNQFKVGDKVKINKDVTAVRELQKGHGGWNDDMEKVSDMSKNF